MIDGFGYDRNLTLTDHRASVAINHGHPVIDDFGYGIFDLRIASLVTNLAFATIGSIKNANLLNKFGSTQIHLPPSTLFFIGATNAMVGL
jgi:hypothetical protein